MPLSIYGNRVFAYISISADRWASKNKGVYILIPLLLVSLLVTKFVWLPLIDKFRKEYLIYKDYELAQINYLLNTGNQSFTQPGLTA